MDASCLHYSGCIHAYFRSVSDTAGRSHAEEICKICDPTSFLRGCITEDATPRFTEFVASCQVVHTHWHF